MSDAIRTAVTDGVAVITINRPEARNAVNAECAGGLAGAVEEFAGRKDVSVLVLTGAAGTFSAGMDLKGFLAGEAPVSPGRGFGGIAERPPVKPVIAAVEGYALAGGFELVLACDLVVASEEAKFGLPEVRRGLVAGAGGLLRLPRRIPYNGAMEIALTGAPFPAARLGEVGLVNKLVPAGHGQPAAVELAGGVGVCGGCWAGGGGGGGGVAGGGGGGGGGGRRGGGGGGGGGGGEGGGGGGGGGGRVGGG